jgi:hypothetical protein
MKTKATILAVAAFCCLAVPGAAESAALAGASVRLTCKNGKSETRHVPLVCQPDGAWRFELRTIDMPDDLVRVTLVNDAAVRRRGDPGWWMIDDGRWGEFTRDDGKPASSPRMLMPFFGMKTGEGKAWFAIVKGLRLECTDAVTVKDGVYTLAVTLNVAGIGFRPYENWVVDFYELEGDNASYSGMGRLYRNWQLERGAVRPLARKPAFRAAVSFTGVLLRQLRRGDEIPCLLFGRDRT